MTYEESVEAAQNLVAEAEAEEDRIKAMIARVQGIGGELGDLLRAIGESYREWDFEAEYGSVNDAESKRMERIAFAALALFEAWKLGER